VESSDHKIAPGRRRLPDHFAQRLRSVDHEQHPLLDVEPAVDQIGQQRRDDRRRDRIGEAAADLRDEPIPLVRACGLQ
jgi:hypothetical protein